MNIFFDYKMNVASAPNETFSMHATIRRGVSLLLTVT